MSCCFGGGGRKKKKEKQEAAGWKDEPQQKKQVKEDWLGPVQAPPAGSAKVESAQDKDEVSGKGHEQPLTNGDKPVSPLKETDSARDINEQSLAGSTKDIGVPVESDQSPSAEKTAEDESPPAAEKASDAQAPPSPSTQDKEDQASPTLDPGDVQVVESPAGPAAQSIGTVQEEEDEAEVQVRGDQQGQIHQVQQQQHLHQHQQFQQRQQQQQQQPEASGEVSTASLISSAKPTSPGPSPAPSMASSLSTGMPYPSTSISNMLPPRATAAAILTGALPSQPPLAGGGWPAGLSGTVSP
eukprot:CAMPEP_0202376342 /NCGR_PEP_ID=MMETSP1127-20130417/6851_1 /ASSEMBLY_ACC=CAM_ASM_000462 /TAXON_ID=3047 /ORGANISM="Dunaliella tertiolecta, Strain CCMP1320" /LENGTH=297 /DNA_ID=CAMNT_0048974097 /DNA_START=94 /DNA_END=984 /DNA_ORIENTATION=-